ncbi:MAG: MFS transporter, partial [Scytonema sp. CRU_2_7]|nr:MFS transporter [Scytonema sp. CRU_2_7]
MVDVNPKTQHTSVLGSFVKNSISGDTQNSRHTIDTQLETTEKNTQSTPDLSAIKGILNNSNFLMFLFYFSFRMLACNLSTPYFNFYMLDTMHLDVSLVTVYGSLQAGANLLMLIVWGKLSDKIGNHPILILTGILLIVIPLFWLGIDVSFCSIWLWLPFLHMLAGGTWAGVDLCSNNMQLGIAPVKQQSIYFAMTAAVGGASGALGTTMGGLIAQNPSLGGLQGLFAISFVFRLAALIPLFFVQEPRRNSFTQMIQTLWRFRKRIVQN